MIQILRNSTILILLLLILFGCKQKSEKITIENSFPWCIVAYDSLERTPSERIKI